MALEPFEVLYEARVPAYPLPKDLERIYSRLGFDGPAVYSNFVSSLDGVVALGDALSAGSILSARHPADRFLMGLLRACADAVVIGAGTLRATPGHLWTPGHVFPELAASFAELRERLGRTPEPRLVVVTASGDVDPSHPAVGRGATFVTTNEGATKIARSVKGPHETISSGGAHVDLRHAFDVLRDRGNHVILTEGGPHLMGLLIGEGLLDELFVTISPGLAGSRDGKRLGMVEGVELLPEHRVWTSLLSVRRHGDYLFLRHRMPAREARASSRPAIRAGISSPVRAGRAPALGRLLRRLPG
jgi:riboflavin biosynthesis pyrimidine reductase